MLNERTCRIRALDAAANVTVGLRVGIVLAAADKKRNNVKNQITIALKGWVAHSEVGVGCAKGVIEN